MRKAALILTLAGLIPVLIYAVMTLLMRMDVIGFGTVFGQLGWLVPALGIGGVAAALGGIVMFWQRALFPGVVSLIVAAAAFAMMSGPVLLKRTAGEVPPIHDISTDTDDPPAFVAILPLRTDATNPAEYDREQTEQQLAYYTDLETKLIERPLGEVFEMARAAMEAEGIRIVAAEPSVGRIEGVATTRWFGFKDDVVIRLRDAHGVASVVDIRSKSRVGRSDVGANAARIEALLDRIEEAAANA